MILHSIVVSFFCALLSTSSASTCTCDPRGTFRRQFERRLEMSAAVFTGTVVGFKWHITELDPGLPNSKMMLRGAVLVPQSVWKGVGTDTLIVWTADNEGACGFPFEEGKEYLVFASIRDSVSFNTNLCAGTQPVEAAGRYLELLGYPRDTTGSRRP
jgi:hypothetical protein